MGLDVGVVRINYIERPRGIVYGFLWYLDYHAFDADWEVSCGSDTFVGYTYGNIVGQAEQFSEMEDLNEHDRAQVMSWIGKLPWNQSTIMLHLTW